MSRWRSPGPEPDPVDWKRALLELDADGLRSLIVDLVENLDPGTREGAIDQVVARAARESSTWRPDGPTEAALAETLAFAESARRMGYTDPRVVDLHLRRGCRAFHRREYSVAQRIFGALLPPIGQAEIDVGQEEMADEVLSVDLADCAARHVVSAYMTSDRARRLGAVRLALREVGSLGLFDRPLGELERVAVEPLPRFDDFLAQWRASLEEEVAARPSSDGWPSEDERRLREVVWRLEGIDGLAAIARESRDGEALRAWCTAVVETEDWRAARAAFDEAAEIVRDPNPWRGEFLDGAAAAAQESGAEDLPRRLRRAWRAGPSLPRLLRWLGSAESAERVRWSAERALEECPESALRQRLFLHFVLGDYESASKLVPAAPGVGWSHPEHPGHLFTSLIKELLGAPGRPASASLEETTAGVVEVDDWNSLVSDGPRLRTPEPGRILERSGAVAPLTCRSRAILLAALRQVAETRIERVVGQKARGRYPHAAWLVHLHASLDPSEDAQQWVQGLRARYSRYPALRREFDGPPKQRG